MVDFSRLKSLRHETCQDCGEDFTTHREDAAVCTQCAFYRTNPEMAPKYWAWIRIPNNEWGIAARWPEKDELPLPGDTVVVHRRNGTTSNETIGEVLRTYYSRSLNLQVLCKVA